MLCTKLTMIMVFVLFLGLVSCLASDKIRLNPAIPEKVKLSPAISEKVRLSPAIKEKVTEVKAKMVILIYEEGNIVVTDSEGKRLNKCTIGPSKKQCRGLQKGYGVENLNSITIIQSKGSPFCYTVYDMQGMAEEICWDK